MKLEDKVNEAITYHLLPFYNTEVIKAKFGQDVFKVIDEIASYATNNVLWLTNDAVEGHREVIDRLLVKYPFLTDTAKIKIADVPHSFGRRTDAIQVLNTHYKTQNLHLYELILICLEGTFVTLQGPLEGGE